MSKQNKIVQLTVAIFFISIQLTAQIITPAKEDTLPVQKILYGNNPGAGNYFNTGDVKLYYEVYGAGAPILLLHGGVYGYIDEFEYLIEKLAVNYKVICLGTRGHGKSEIGNQPFTYRQRADDAYKILKHLQIDEVTVIGFSDGGYSAYKLAALYPESVSKMVVMGAGDVTNSKREKFTYSEISLMKESEKYFIERRKLMPQPERWNESLTMLNDFYNKDLIGAETFKKIKCPVLVMAGDGDEYLKVEGVVSCFRQISNAKLSIIPNCGHVIFYCNFPAVWESMKGFISGDGIEK